MGVDRDREREIEREKEKEINYSFSCSLCDSDVPVESDIKPGDIYFCSYCKVGLKVIRKGERLTLEFEDEE